MAQENKYKIISTVPMELLSNIFSIANIILGQFTFVFDERNIAFLFFKLHCVQYNFILSPIGVCVCTCACACAYAYTCVCACVHVCLFIHTCK